MTGDKKSKQKKMNDHSVTLARKISENRLLKVGAKYKLNQQQLGFVREYLKNPNRTKKELMLTAGYSLYTANHGGDNPMRKPAVISAITDYIRAGGYDANLKQTYKEAFALNPEQFHDVSEKVAIIKVKLEAAKELHKIRGDYAPKQIDKRELKMFGEIGSVFESCNDDANTVEGEIIPDPELHKK